MDADQILADEITVWAVVVGGIAVAAALIMFSALLVRSARYPGMTPLIAPLSMLALVAMLIGGLVESAQELIPIAGAAVGALAAVLTSVTKDRKKDDDSQS